MQKAFGVLAAVDAMSPSELTDYALRLEELGYDALWLPDVGGREIFSTASFVLSNTTVLRTATGIANVYARDWMTAAQSARTLSELYGGRFILGLGVSHPRSAEKRGVEWLPPLRKLSAYLEGIASAELYSPEPSRPAPVYIAAHGPKLLALAARSADGANTYLMPPRHTKEAREILGTDKDLNVVLPCCLCEDAERARHVGRKGLAIYIGLPAYRRQWTRMGYSEADFENGGSDRLVDEIIAWGDEAALRERIAAHVDAGASQIEILPYNPEGRGPHWKLLEGLAPAAA